MINPQLPCDKSDFKKCVSFDWPSINSSYMMSFIVALVTLFCSTLPVWNSCLWSCKVAAWTPEPFTDHTYGKRAGCVNGAELSGVNITASHTQYLGTTEPCVNKRRGVSYIAWSYWGQERNGGTEALQMFFISGPQGRLLLQHLALPAWSTAALPQSDWEQTLAAAAAAVRVHLPRSRTLFRLWASFWASLCHCICI